MVRGGEIPLSTRLCLKSGLYAWVAGARRRETPQIHEPGHRSAVPLATLPSVFRQSLWQNAEMMRFPYIACLARKGNRQPMETLLEAFGSLFASLWLLAVTLWHLLLPWALIVIWVLWWLLAVDWRALVPTLKQGAWVAIALLGAAVVLVWGCLQPDAQSVFGYEMRSFTAKAVIVAALYTLALAAGALQLAWLKPSAAK